MKKFYSIACLLLLSCHQPTQQEVSESAKSISKEGQDPGNPSTFSKTFNHKGLSLNLTVTGSGSIRRLKIESAGKILLERDVVGTLEDAAMADLDKNDEPEIYIICRSAGSGGYVEILSFLWKGPSLQPVYFPEVDPDDPLFQGYMGHDAISISAERLQRKFPVYREGDPNAAPSGGERNLLYKLSCKNDSCGFSIVADATDQKRD